MRTSRRLFSLILIVGLAICISGHVPGIAGQSAAATFDVKALDTFVAEQLKTKGLVGLSLAVMKDGRVLLAKGYGVSSLAGKQPVAEDTLFAIGSITKQFTSACVLLLAEDGKLTVNDKVAKYYPNLTRANDITLLDLMNHVSGYPDYYPLDFVDRRMQKAIAVDEVIRQYGTTKLDFEPGTKWSYSNTGFLILGRVVEKVSGEPFGQILSRRVLKPVGMDHTAYEPDPKAGGLARGHSSFALSPPEEAIPEEKGWIAAAGALYSTPTDLAKWDLALIEGKVLKPESYKLMTTSRKLADGRLAGYGCGLSVGERNGVTVLSHNGAVAGFYALNTMIPSSKSAAILLSNFDEYNEVGTIYSRVLRSLWPTAAANPDLPKIAGLPAPEAAKAFFTRLQAGTVDRSELGEEFSYFLTDAKIRGAAERLKPYGEPTGAEVESSHERGGMEVTSIRLTFKSGILKISMYRSPDGKMQQYFVQKD
jgi:D-alanyl-D-alanine carboxypeptidase